MTRLFVHCHQYAVEDAERMDLESPDFAGTGNGIVAVADGIAFIHTGTDTGYIDGCPTLATRCRG